MSSPVLLSTVSAIGPYANLPTFGIPGRRYYATDTRQEWYDTGLAWVLIQPAGTSGSSQSTVSGSTSGSAVFSQPFEDAYYKKVIVVLLSLNGSASYTFPTPFTEIPDYTIGISASGATLTTLSTTEVTISGAPSTGAIVLEGF